MNNARRMNARVEGDGELTVVLANGFCTSAESWEAMLPYLAGTRLVRFEYIGCAGTPEDAWFPQRYDTLYGHADDVVALLEELGVNQAVFIGHSMSAMVGALAQIAAPALVRQIVMLGASPRYLDDEGYSGGFSREVIEALFIEAERDLAQWIAGFAPRALGEQALPVQVQAYADHLLAMRPDVARLTIQSIFMSDFRHVLERVHCPVDILQSADDVAVPRPVAEYLAAMLPQGRLHILPVSGHVPHLTHAHIVGPVLQDIIQRVR